LIFLFGRQEGGGVKVKGYYDPEQSGKGLEVPTGRLSIEGRNMPEFRKLVEQAKKEADQLKKRLISSSILN
jgi:hypothetical protein